MNKNKKKRIKTGGLSIVQSSFFFFSSTFSISYPVKSQIKNGFAAEKKRKTKQQKNSLETGWRE